MISLGADFVPPATRAFEGWGACPSCEGRRPLLVARSPAALQPISPSATFELVCGFEL
jgi:hypothetical protein